MSYMSAMRSDDGNQVLVWERTTKGRVLKKYPSILEFYTQDDDGEYQSVYGDKLQKHSFATFSEFNRAKNQLHGKKLYEASIDLETKVLSKHYYNSKPPELHVTFLDIEIDYDPTIGFGSTMNPYAPINAIALQHYWNDKSVVLVVPPPEWDGVLDPTLSELATIIICRDERDLLNKFLIEIEDSDLLCGWNSDIFDMPYIYQRVKRVLLDQGLKRLSFLEAKRAPYARPIEIFNVEQFAVDLYGRSSLDYMQLFIKYEMDKRPSYALESIAEEILPHLPKLSYVGSLAKLYHKNFNYFIRYNIRDCEILKGFEDILGYVQVANVMIHTSCAQFKHAMGTLALTDLAIVNRCHHVENVVVPDWSDDKPDGSINGACVLFPQVGMHQYIGSIDMTSLYPTAIRSANISPETIVGQFADGEIAWELIVNDSDVLLEFNYDKGDKTEVRSAEEWKQFLLSKQWAISAWGTVFDQTKQGVVPALLTSWFQQRKEYQKLKKETGELLAKEKEGTAKHKKLNDLYTYYDKMQYVYKIKLNSAYGALTNYYFRFFDLRMGESTTATGRALLKHQCRIVNQVLDGEYNVDFPLYGTIADALEEKSKDRNGRPIPRGTIEEALEGPIFNGRYQAKSVIYGDTDSCYFATGASNVDEAIKVADYVAKKVNESFQGFMQKSFLCNEGYDDLAKAGREVVTGWGIFVSKKRYVLHLLDKEGKRVDEFKVMGLDMKKTTIPKHIAKQLLKIIEGILRGKPWIDTEQDIVDYKDKLMDTTNILEIGLPKGIKGVEDYTKAFELDVTTRLPGHVAAAIHYNQRLDHYQDKESPRITSGMKIKVYYLLSKHGKFKSIALPTDIDQIPEWFVENYSNQINYKAQIDRLVDNPLQNIFDAIGKIVPTKHSMLVDTLLIY